MTTLPKTTFTPFSLGLVVTTAGATESVPYAQMKEGLARHKRGDWGNVCKEDAAENNRSTHEGFRVLSAYAIDPSKPAKGYGENCFWIITEADRSATTILLPDEY